MPYFNINKELIIVWKETLPNGKIKFREYYFDPLTGKKRTVSITYNKHTKKIEQDALLILQEKIADKLKISARNITFGELIEKWLKEYKTHVKPNTYRSRKSDTSRIKEKFENVLLEKLDYSMFNNFLLNLKHEGLAKNTVTSYHTTIKLILNFGLFLGDLKERSVIENISMPAYKKEVVETDFSFLEQDELEKVLEQLKEVNYEEIARTCLIQAQTGMRHGELTALDYNKHINFKEKEILVERTWIHAEQDFGPPKNNKVRTIYFNEDTEKLLREQIQYSQLKTMFYGLSKETLLFKDNNGNPRSLNTVNDILRDYVDIPNKSVTTHIFRHTFITKAMEEGIPLHLIAEHVGNTTATIEKYYKHFSKKMKSTLEVEIDKLTFGL